MASLPHIEIILPVFNEVDAIHPLLDELDAATVLLKEQARFSLLFINDGSTDGTKALLHQLRQQRGDTRVIDLIHNFGHTAAISCGLQHFSADAVILMDADLQDSPAAIPDLFNAWQQGAKTVVAERGSRAEKAGPLFRFFYFLLHKISPTLPPINFGTFSLLDQTVVERIKLLGETNRYFPGLISYASDTITPIRIDRHARINGTSRVGLFGLVHLAITAFVSFSNAPVRLAAILGLFCSAAALLAVAIIISIKLFTSTAIPGWASLMTTVFFGSGIQLLCLGIIGEYVSRIYDEVKKRPAYFVDQHPSQDRLYDKAPRQPAYHIDPFPENESIEVAQEKVA